MALVKSRIKLARHVLNLQALQRELQLYNPAGLQKAANAGAAKEQRLKYAALRLAYTQEKQAFFKAANWLKTLGLLGAGAAGAAGICAAYKGLTGKGDGANVGNVFTRLPKALQYAYSGNLDGNVRQTPGLKVVYPDQYVKVPGTEYKAPQQNTYSFDPNNGKFDMRHTSAAPLPAQLQAPKGPVVPAPGAAVTAAPGSAGTAPSNEMSQIMERLRRMEIQQRNQRTPSYRYPGNGYGIPNRTSYWDY